MGLLYLLLDGGGWSSSRSGRFTPGKDSVPVVQEVGQGPGQIWTVREIFPFTPDRPARSYSLC
jgi:hypothetical protein